MSDFAEWWAAAGSTRRYECALNLRDENQELRSQLEEALGIIKDLADLHDSYIGYLVTHNNYNDASAKALYERIQVLWLKQ